MVEVVERKDLEQVDVELAKLRLGIEALSERIESLEPSQPKYWPEVVGAPLPDRLTFGKRPDPSPGLLRDSSSAQLGELRPFRRSPHAKDQILTAGGRVFLGVFDPEVIPALVEILNRS